MNNVHRWSRHGLLVAVAAFATQMVVGNTVPEAYLPGLNSILKEAVSQSPRMINRNLDLEIADNDLVQSKSGLLPNVGGYTRFAKTRDDRADQTGTVSVDKVAFDWQVSQAVFHWGALRNNARIGEIRKEMAQGNYRDGYRMLAQEIRSQYLGLIVRKNYLARARFNLAHQRELLTQAEARYEKREISDTQVSMARLSVEQAELSLDRTADDYDNFKAGFSRLVGRGATIADEDIPDDVPAINYEKGGFDSLLAGFLSQKEPMTITALNRRKQLEIEKLNYEVSKTRLLPKFNVVAGVTQDEQSYSLNVAQRYRVLSYYAGLQVSWTIFDGLAARAATANVLARMRQIENDQRMYLDSLGSTMQSQARQIDFAARQMSLADRGLAGNISLLATRKDEARRGLASDADVRQVELSVMDARIGAINSRSDYLMKSADFVGQTSGDPVLANLPQR